LRRPKYRNFIATDGHALDDNAKDVALIASLSGESESIINEIDIDDIAVLRDALIPVWFSFFDSSKPYIENPPQPEAETP
jgi:hypothetical protein